MESRVDSEISKLNDSTLNACRIDGSYVPVTAWPVCREAVSCNDTLPFPDNRWAIKRDLSHQSTDSQI